MNRQRVNNAKSLGDTRIWTKDLPDCSRLLYHWAISPAYIYLIITYIQIFITSIVPDNEKKSKSNKYDVFKKNSYTRSVVFERGLYAVQCSTSTARWRVHMYIVQYIPRVYLPVA